MISFAVLVCGRLGPLCCPPFLTAARGGLNDTGRDFRARRHALGGRDVQASAGIFRGLSQQAAVCAIPDTHVSHSSAFSSYDAVPGIRYPPSVQPKVIVFVCFFYILGAICSQPRKTDAACCILSTKTRALVVEIRFDRAMARNNGGQKNIVSRRVLQQLLCCGSIEIPLHRFLSQLDCRKFYLSVAGRFLF